MPHDAGLKILIRINAQRKAATINSPEPLIGWIAAVCGRRHEHSIGEVRRKR
jgi:hypothetical protein